jgi:hypothetical protein
VNQRKTSASSVSIRFSASGVRQMWKISSICFAHFPRSIAFLKHLSSHLALTHIYMQWERVARF